jgi:hypothetical protein
VNGVRKLDHFKKEQGYAVFCPAGEVSFNEMAELVHRAVLLCRKQKIKKLLIDSTELHGFKTPGISERYNLAERMAQEAASLVKIAHVASPEWIRSGEFGIEVARNRGLDAKNFKSEPEALKWLLTEPAPQQRSITQKTG